MMSDFLEGNNDTDKQMDRFEQIIIERLIAMSRVTTAMPYRLLSSVST